MDRGELLRLTLICGGLGLTVAHLGNARDSMWIVASYSGLIALALYAHWRK